MTLTRSNVALAPERTASAATRSVGRLGSWRPQGDALAILCLLLVLGIDLALIRVGLDVQDEGYFVEQASRVLHGDLPYRDFDSLYTPGLLYLHAALFSLLGEPHVLIVRATGLVARAVLAGGLYLVCRPLARPAIAILPGLYILVALDRLPLTWEPHPGWPSAALTVLSAWAFGRLPQLSGRRRMCWVVGIGACAALVFAFKQNAGVFLGLALIAFAAWQGISATRTAVTPGLRLLQLLLLGAVLLAAAWLIRPHADAVTAVYFLVPLAAAGFAAVHKVPVSSAGQGVLSWLAMLLLLGLGFCAITLPWLAVLIAALDGRVEPLRGFIGAVDQNLPWYLLQGPDGGGWVCLLGFTAALLAGVCFRHNRLLLGVAVLALAGFGVSGVLLTAPPGESVWLASMLLPERAAAQLSTLLPVVCILAGAWQAMRSPPGRATWRLRWLTVAGALTFLTEYPRIDEVHLTWAACLPLATGAVVVGQLHSHLAKRWRTGRVGRTIIGVALLAVPAATVLPGIAARADGALDLARNGQLAPHRSTLWTTMHLPAVDGVLVADKQASSLQGVVEFVDSNTVPGEPIFVYPSAPLVYVMADRPNPTRFGHLYPSAASSDELERVITTLDQTPVRVLVVSYSALSFWGPPAQNEPLEAYLSDSYHEAARFREYRVFVRNS
jgi:hypothetical protein